jgi:membrane fusion protein (multidrug efflux system)
MSTPDSTAPKPATQPVPSTRVTATAPREIADALPAGSERASPVDRGHGPKHRWWLWIVGGVILLVALLAGGVWFVLSLSTVSTDDAYVNGHVTFVAARVPGQVVGASPSRPGGGVLVDDNNRVRQGDLLVQLDKEPYQVQVDIAQAAVEAAQADLITAQAQVRGTEGQMRSLRFSLDRAIEDVHNQVALLRVKVATLQSQKATVERAQADYERGKGLFAAAAMSKEEFDLRKENLLVAQARQEEALQGVYQVRVALGLSPRPEKGDDLGQVPPNLDQTFSSVKQAQYNLLHAAAQVGVADSFAKSPQEMIDDFYKRDPSGKRDIDRIFEQFLKDAPVIKQAEAKLAQAKRNLEQAELNLRYCDVKAEIDGVITRRNVNPGNNVVAGQALMAIRSLTDIWVDANFKETQLADLRIGQEVDLDVDMYGSRKRFKGRISGFEMGTGSTLALLPPENATGNFVKVVQRVPVRIDLVDYDPETAPLIIGLSVTPTVRLNREMTGPNAGQVLQPHMERAAPSKEGEKKP